MTERQKRFIDEYIRTGNSSEAARRAGYSSHTAYSIGERLLRNVEVRAAINERLEVMASERLASAEESMELLTGVLRGEITEPFITPGGKKFEIPARISDRLRAAELLLKIYGKFSEKVEVKVDSMERYIAALEEVWSGKVKPDVG